MLHFGVQPFCSGQKMQHLKFWGRGHKGVRWCGFGVTVFGFRRLHFAVFVHFDKTWCGITFLTYLCVVLHLFFMSICLFGPPLWPPLWAMLQGMSTPELLQLKHCVQLFQSRNIDVINWRDIFLLNNAEFQSFWFPNNVYTFPTSNSYCSPFPF